jgi:hypothetical protein
MEERISTGNKKFWEEQIVFFPMIRHRTHRRRRIQQFFYRPLYIPSEGTCFLMYHALPSIIGPSPQSRNH